MAGDGKTKKLAYPKVFLDILELHFEELDFLWEQRQSIIFAADWNLQELHEHEERAEAHLDGLLVSQGHGVDLVLPALGSEEIFAATAATLLLLKTGAPHLGLDVLAKLQGDATPEAREGIRLGLRHSPLDSIRDPLLELAGDGDELLAAIASDILAFQRITPPDPVRLLAAKDAQVRVLGFGALGRLKGLSAPDTLLAALDDEDSEVRLAALRAAALSGMPELLSLCRSASQSHRLGRGEASSFLGVIGEASDLELLLESTDSSTDSPKVTPAVIASLGALGQVGAIPTLLECMADDELALAAGEAFIRITGASDLDKDDEPSEEVAEELELEEEGPRICPEKARTWWNEAHERLQGDGPRQGGQDVSDEAQAAKRFDLPLASRRDLYLRARSQAANKIGDLELEDLAWKQMKASRDQG